MADMNGGSVDPDLRFGNDGRGKTRYPSPFFDISQQYIPPTVKELFKWTYFYVTNNSFLGPAIKKIARYPITDLIFEDASHDLVERWKILMNNTFQIKTFNMEVNFDLMTYGNAFVTIHYPFSRFLVCTQCRETYPWKSVQKKIDNLRVKMKCKKCGNDGDAVIKDVHYKSEQNVRLVRINPEFIDIKYNDATGRHTYLYSIPDKLKRQIMSGDPDILEDTPKIHIDAIRERKKIKLSNQNLFHLKEPTVASKDMGWGLPRIAVAMKDLFHYYTMRRGQEAVLMEHITPFDVIFPQANGKFDPYVHSDLSSWRKEMEKHLAARRKDPNYKAILPFPVGYERISGDGKNLLLTPELDFLAKIVISSAGIPQEFVFGGNMQWSGSSISLRTLENDFLHQRSGIIQMDIWIVERMRIYLGIPAPKSIKMSDFKMADDIQKLQLMIGMASNKKLDWDDILKEMGRDPQVVQRKIEEETEFETKLMRITALAQASIQNQVQQIQLRQQSELQDQAVKEQMRSFGGGGSPDVGADGKEETVAAMAKRLMTQSPHAQAAALARLGGMDPQFAAQLRAAMAQEPLPEHSDVAKPLEERTKAHAGKGSDMRPLPTQRPPRRQGGI